MKKVNLITEDIVVSAQKGDIEAFSKIYNVYYNKVFYVAMHFFQNEHTSKDVVQEVFIRVHQKLTTLKEPKAFHNWILRITYNTCCSFKRGTIKTVDLGESNCAEHWEDRKGTSTVDLVMNQLLKEAILESLNKLSKPLKSVGILRFYEELKIEEIASILDIPVGTVNSRLNKIRRILQRDLKRKGISPTTYLSITLNPFVLRQAYEMLSSIYKVDEESRVLILQRIVNDGFFSKLVRLRDAIVLSLIGFTLISTGIALLNYREPIAVNLKANESINSTKITSISYDKKWTNKPISLKVKATNMQFDKVLINGNRGTTVYKNGVHVVQLAYKGNVIDEKKVNVKNMDIHSPTGYSVRSGNEYTIYLHEDLSGIDPSSIRFYKNMKQSHGYIYDENKKTIKVNSFVGSFDVLYISDYAGNKLEIEIK